jgi:hypothetical protein
MLNSISLFSRHFLAEIICTSIIFVRINFNIIHEDLYDCK